MNNFLKTAIIFVALISIPAFAQMELILGGQRARQDTTGRAGITDERCPEYFMSAEEVAALEGIRGQTITGARSRASVMRFIDRNSNTVRREYRDHILAGNTLSGGMIVRFKIDAQGNVFECRIVESNIEHVIFQKNVVNAIRRWQFPQIDVENDTTIVEYPFVFDRM
ncbi:MAG: TonB family protein [Chitinivibrionia bacterium]|nr:TonB family protein [Chitinivibrionia bacterium]